jgi:outer membrane protein insertion porin family
MIPLNEGELFNQSKWDAGIEQLNRSGLFRPITPADVIMKPDPARGEVDVELNLSEVDHRRVDFSGGGGTTGGAAGSVDYSDINLTGRGDRLRARLTLGTREQSFAGQYSISLISQRQPVIDLSGFFQRTTFAEATLANGDRDPLYTQSSAGGSAGVQFALSRTRYAITAPTRVGVNYSFTSTSLRDQLSTSAGNTTTTEERLQTGALTTFLVHDTLDRFFDPGRGQRLLFGVELSARALGGSFNTVKPFFDLRRFYPLRELDDAARETPVIGLRLRAGHIAAFGERFESETLSTVGGVPVFKRFFSGGEEELRGFDLNSIAPLARVERFIAGSEGDPMLLSSEVRPIGGDSEVVFNTEFRVPLVWQLSTAAFFDIGASFNAKRLETERFVTTVPTQPSGTIDVITVVRRATEPEFQLPSYRYSLGGELRFPVPILNIPVRLIFAFNPNAQTDPPPAALIAPEKKFAFRIGFSRTL